VPLFHLVTSVIARPGYNVICVTIGKPNTISEKTELKNIQELYNSAEFLTINWRERTETHVRVCRLHMRMIHAMTSERRLPFL
jgi:hypothetical protein